VKRVGRPSQGLVARLGVPVGGRVKKLRAVEDHSVPIPEEITSELGRIIEKHEEGLMRALEDRQGYPIVENIMIEVMRGGDRG